MIDKLKNTLKSTIIYSIGNISLKLIGLILLPIYTEHLVVEDYGKWAILEISGQVLVIIFGIRLSVAMIRLFSSEKNENKRRIIIFSAIFLSFVSVLIFNAILHPFTNQFSSLFFGNPNFSTYFHYLIIWSSLEVMNRLTLDFIRIIQKPVLFIIIVTVRFLLVIFLNIYFVANKGMGIEGILLGQLIGSAFLFVFTLPLLLTRMKIRIDWKIIKEIMNYGTPLVFSALAIFLLTMSDRYLIKIMLEYERVGIYSLSYKISSVVKFILIQAFQLGFTPIVFNMFDKQDFRRFVAKIFKYFSFILVFTSLILSIFSKDILLIFSKSDSYLESYKYIPFMLLAFCFQGQQTLFAIGFHYKKQLRMLVWINASAALVNILLNIALLPKYGLYGSVIALIISSFIMAYAAYFIGQRKYPIPFEISKTLLLFLTGGIIYTLSMIIPQPTILIGVIIKTLIIFTFPFVLYLMKFYDPVELQSIKKIWLTWRDPRQWQSNIKRVIGEGMNDENL